MPTGTVKWFKRDKGFGFIVPDEGGDDVFIHVSALERAGLELLEDNDRVRFEIRPSGNGRPTADEVSLLDRDVEQVTGRVKWFDAEKGFGFIKRDDGEGDVFLHASALCAAGLSGVEPDQGVCFELQPARDGRMTAARVSLL